MRRQGEILLAINVGTPTWTTAVTYRGVKQQRITFTNALVPYANAVPT